MKIRIIIVLLAINMQNVSAQFSKLLNRDQYMAQIQLVDEFFDRFNNKEVRPDVSSEITKDRKSNILLLFDLALFKSKKDSLFGEAEKFAEKVISDSVIINYSDTTWYAKAICRSSFKKQTVDFTLYLKVEKRENGLFKWVISKAEGKVLSLKSDKKHKQQMLMPDDHETNFMSLFRMTDETSEFITDFTSSSFDVDETSVFLTLVKMGLLKIEYVKDLQFYFNQVPGYQFSIKYVERENMNAGWLINSFKKL